MRVLSKIIATAALAGAVLTGTALTGCGGGSDGPPGPLAQHFDDMYIASIPPSSKPSVVQTQQEWSLARMENAKAEAEFNESATQLSIARNDQKAAHLNVESAVSAKKSAEASADTNRIGQASKELHTAEDVAKAADARVKYIEAYRAYLQLAMRHAQENMYWREAQFELAKAQLAQQNSIAPKGVQYEWYPKQEQERNKRAESARGKSESEKARAQSARENWIRQQQAADQASGKSTSLPDPMAPAVQPTTAPPVAPAPAQ